MIEKRKCSSSFVCFCRFFFQTELEEKQRKQLINDRRHATALIQAHQRGDLAKQMSTSRIE